MRNINDGRGYDEPATPEQTERWAAEARLDKLCRDYRMWLVHNGITFLRALPDFPIRYDVVPVERREEAGGEWTYTHHREVLFTGTWRECERWVCTNVAPTPPELLGVI